MSIAASLIVTVKEVKTILYHKFPQPNKSKVVATNSLGIEKVDKYKLKMGKPATKHMCVCWLHFCKEDFVLPGRES